MAVFTFPGDRTISQARPFIPFCTHEGSGLGRSESDIRQTCPAAKVLKGIIYKRRERFQRAEE